MAGVPVFIEVVSTAQHANVQVCRKIMALLFKERIAPLPFAASAKELTDVLAALKARNLSPAVFIINTFYAEELMPQIDPLIGEKPVVLLRRQIFSEPLFARPGGNGATLPTMTQVIQKMIPRLSTEWSYGSQSGDEVAANGAKALLQFLNTGKFTVLEDYSQTQAMAMFRSRMEPRETAVRPGSGTLGRLGTGKFPPVGATPKVNGLPGTGKFPPVGTPPKGNGLPGTGKFSPVT